MGVAAHARAPLPQALVGKPQPVLTQEALPREPGGTLHSLLPQQGIPAGKDWQSRGSTFSPWVREPWAEEEGLADWAQAPGCLGEGGAWNLGRGQPSMILH